MEGIEGSNLTRSRGWLGWPPLTMILTMIGAFTLKKPIVHNDFDNDDYGWEWWHCQWHSVRQSLHSYLKDITTLLWTLDYEFDDLEYIVHVKDIITLLWTVDASMLPSF